jgi:hypothetical protein
MKQSCFSVPGKKVNGNIESMQKTVGWWMSADFTVDTGTGDVTGSGIIIDPGGEAIPGQSEGITGWYGGEKKWGLFNGGMTIDTGDFGQGLIVGDLADGLGWNMNSKGLFAYAGKDGAQLLEGHAFALQDNIPWQQGTPFGLVPENPDFTLGLSDIVLGPFNYGRGLFLDYSAGRFYAKGLDIIAPVFEPGAIDYSKISSGPPADADKTSNNTAANVTGQGPLATVNFADWATQVDGTGKPANGADVTATTMYSTSIIKDSGNLQMNAGAGIIFHGNNVNTSAIMFEPITDATKWTKIESHYEGSVGILEMRPHSSAGDTELRLGKTGYLWSAARIDVAGNVNITANRVTVNGNSVLDAGDIGSSSGQVAAGNHGHGTTYAAYSHSHNQYSLTTHGHSWYAASTHSHPWSQIYSKPLLDLYAGYTRSTGSLHPNTNKQHGFGRSGYAWHSAYIETVHYTFLGGLDNEDDLALIDKFTPLLDKDGKTTIKDGLQVMDLAAIPDVVTNKTTLAEESEDIWGVHLTVPELNKILSKEIIHPTVTRAMVKDHIYMNAGKVIPLAVGGIKQLNREVTEDVMEQLNHVLENIIGRVNKLEKVGA